MKSSESFLQDLGLLYLKVVTVTLNTNKLDAHDRFDLHIAPQLTFLLSRVSSVYRAQLF